MANAGDANAISLFLLNLPTSHQSYWWESTQLHNLLQRGGFPRVPHQTVVNSLKSRQSTLSTVCRDRFSNTIYFLFGAGTEGISCYKAQRDRGIRTPRITPDYFFKPGLRPLFSAALEHMSSQGYCRQRVRLMVEILGIRLPEEFRKQNVVQDVVTVE